MEKMKLSEIANRIKKEIKGVKSIVIYGSRVRGDYGPASDYDLIVVCEKLPDNFEDRIEIESRVGNELILKGIQISMILLTPEELFFSMNVPDPLMIEVYFNHKILYDDGTFKKALKIIEPKVKRSVYIPEFGARKIK